MMANNIDFSSLKARAIGSGLDEEAVTVNTRALIDKVLARYSGEWTVLRELLQNAADASATRVVIKLETTPSTTVPAPISTDDNTLIKHVISHHTIKRLTLRNNGTPFNANDWARLKRIAEGNPDETKIGAFGVGFYSVFSDCEEPFVSSGKEAIAFYWKENALFTRRLKLDERDCSPDTVFVLDYRNTSSPVPGLMSLCQFLASSLTFVGLEAIELWLDNWNLLKLSKKLAPSVLVTIPRDIATKTPDGIMRIADITREVAQLDAACMKAVGWKSPSNSSRYEGNRVHDTTASLRSFFSRLTGSSTGDDKLTKSERSGRNGAEEALVSYNTSSVFLQITTGHIKTSVTSSFSRELERATKKPPPKTTKLAILTSSYTASPSSEAPEGQDIFSSVIPSRSGRIYIGFPTHQTTGLNAHVSAPSLIPTVERESIDLNARWVRTWNLELLKAVGIVCRIAWSAEMSSLKDQLLFRLKQAGKATLQIEDINAVLSEAIHISNQFVFRESTPTSQVGQAVEDSFWTCSQNAYLEILSTRGILPSHQVRTAPKDLSFMDGIPVLPERLVLEAKGFIGRLIEFGLITEVTISDMKTELENKALTSSQLHEFISWISRKSVSGEINQSTVKALLGVAVANNDEGDSGPALLVLRDISCFANLSRIPLEMPLPPFVLPPKYSKTLSPNGLTSIGWQELQVDAWVQWLVHNASNRALLSAEQDITRSQSFSARVLPVISKQWDILSPTSKMGLIDVLRQHTIIPTKGGMRKPQEAYFPSVRIFDDLPIVTGLNSVKEKFLVSLGVRKTVDISIIFERLLSGPENGTDASEGSQGKWSHVELIKYLASVRQDIPPEDTIKLRKARICSAEVRGEEKPSRQRYQVSQLFEPNDALRDLGFPLLYWPGKYVPLSPEGRFLLSLGLKSVPTAPEMIKVMADAAAANDMKLRDKAMGYFITHHVSNNYASFDYSQSTAPFLPIEGGGLSNPSNCFTAEGAALFGFDILRRDLHPHALKFGVNQHPSINECITILIRKRPESKPQAKALFKYMASRVAEINPASAARLGQAPIVPIYRKSLTEKGTTTIHYVAPRDCYLGDSEDYGDIFEFVDFGSEGNLFLLSCGSKRQPTHCELASILVKEPTRISSKLQSSEKYLRLLRGIAENLSTIKKDKSLFAEMKKAPFLFASKEIPRTPTAKKSLLDTGEFSDEEDEDQAIKEWHLTKAADAVIVDDYSSFSLFKEKLLAAPQEELLEDMYSTLGSPNLSSLVDEQAQCGRLSSDQRSAWKLQRHIYERSRLFLHDLPRDTIRHDTRWLEKNLSVQMVQGIKLRRSLRGWGMSHVEDRSAVMIQKPNSIVLSISEGRPDLYQVSQALVSTILLRPKLHSTLTLEMLLKTDLLELRARGYNVERILRQKAAEARIAEQQRQDQHEKERQQMQQMQEMEQKRMQELEESQRQAVQQQHEAAMPGFFPGSPTNSLTRRQPPPVPAASGENHPPPGLFSDFAKRFGLNDYIQKKPLETAQNLKKRLSDKFTPSDEGTKDPNQLVTTSPEALQSQLLSAINASRPFTSNEMRSQGQQKEIEEKKTYCDERPAHDLKFLCVVGGVKAFIGKEFNDPDSFLRANHANMVIFTAILIDCAKIFNLRLETLSIFYENSGKTIAFNSSGSLFCNYAYFERLHLEKVARGDRKEGLVYWFVILCHELAHNIVADHGPEHGFYT
ncbi:uncharacterized protein GIQ15_03042 [Arthroderma uncinatum]|uniref:uncharacterized protein n=1 Tax=Arthroderma uncinatum TaxID=74035 RepID=UPI00144A5F1F|nr:uncharacterized protein GIQ15_03042 [Arthroderma uncinatum]KAF3483718.1 hypothetical protein GIQ15_03042 [Arthroderma uncinatum]